LNIPIVLAFASGLVAGSLLTASLAVARPGSELSAASKSTSRVVLENDRVRVKEAVFAPGDTQAAMHTHEYPHVGVVIDGGTLRFTAPDGATETLHLVSGGVGYRNANVSHQAVNTGREPVRVIEVEIK